MIGNAIRGLELILKPTQINVEHSFKNGLATLFSTLTYQYRMNLHKLKAMLKQNFVLLNKAIKLNE